MSLPKKVSGVCPERLSCSGVANPATTFSVMGSAIGASGSLWARTVADVSKSRHASDKIRYLFIIRSSFFG
jgi:hypothetical protein